MLAPQLLMVPHGPFASVLPVQHVLSPLCRHLPTVVLGHASASVHPQQAFPVHGCLLLRRESHAAAWVMQEPLWGGTSGPTSASLSASPPGLRKNTGEEVPHSSVEVVCSCTCS